MQAVEAAEVEHAAVLARRGRHEFAAQAGQRRVPVRNHRGQPIERAAQDDDDKSPVGRRIRQRQGDAAEGEGRCETEQGGATGQVRHHRLWNSGEVSSSVSASRREPAPCMALSVAGCSSGPRLASATSAGSGPLNLPATA